ncbi:hypothetical protein GALMADRAFT_71239 [Galerina marginata CBS 339.88]|uniref:Alpha/beta hydrolase fold-3 domain-containing protein n=1 Tax=Galerina marginata (strain CBS 339.88) TaxID=685588 RepID=A0A067T4X0_GALM3|nr:hypothetical protein GALMADRAFT_71239 [Galerina marginata CBS 339.88]
MLKSPFSELGRSKSWKRVLLDSATLWLAINLNRRQLRVVFGEAWGTYHAYMKSKKLKPVVEETGADGRLLWIGPKRTERVILYIHGGAFLFGPLESGPILWGYIQDNLQERGKPTGVAFLNYSLVPDAIFPTQLKQAVLAIQHLIVSGAAPENIQLTGDSAGGLIIHQIFSHILHPVDGVPKLKLSAPLGGAYMMAPWATTVDDEVYHTNDNAGDVVTASVLLYWASKMYEGVPRSAMPYLNPNGAPDDWLRGIDKVVNRVLISAGGAEVLRDAVIKYFKTIEKHHKNTTFFLQDKGAHVETFLLLLVRDEDTKFAPFLLDWLEQGFS